MGLTWRFLLCSFRFLVEPMQSPDYPIFGALNNADLINVIVILSAIMTAIAIIVLINKKFTKEQ